jgi:CubicO group peptidase (beta-lactamase class C family)
MNRTLLVVMAATLINVRAQDAGALRTAIAKRIDSASSVGIVAGTIGPNGRGVLVHGCAVRNCDQPLRPDAIFEIGSITKLFTALLLADMAERGEVRVEDPVSKYLPDAVSVPSRNGRQITLLDLATHFSGLPRLPDNLSPADPANPYADYGATQLYDFLSRFRLTREPGERHEYSNLGTGLLGHVLSLRAGMSYEELVRQRILEPLGMTNTAITLTEAQRQTAATGHARDMKPVAMWDFDALAGAGAIRSTAGDMLAFAAAQLGITDTPLKASIARMQSFRRPAGSAELYQMAGWLVIEKYGTEILFHDGGTAGFRSAIALDPSSKRGVIILANTAVDVTDLALHTLQSPVARPRIEVAVSEKVLDAYAGEYRFGPSFAITISRKSDRLLGQATNQPVFEMFPESDSRFFLKVVDAQITFLKDESGAVSGLILHQMGRDQRARKVR